MTNDSSTLRAAEDTVLAARIRKSAIVEIRVLTQSFRGKRFVHIREYVLGDDNEFGPTRKGVSFPLDQLPAVADAVSVLYKSSSTPGVAASLENSSGEVRFSVAAWKGEVKADIRVWFHDPAGELQAGKGLRFNLSLLPEILRALTALNQDAGISASSIRRV